MAEAPGSQPDDTQSARSRLASLPVLFYVLLAAALLLGLWARFKGLGKWPFHADEYYIARSVQNILRSGLPEYACGGIYARGLIFQYAVALLQLLGLSPELAPRLIAAIASLVTLPAVYLLGVRVQGRTVGLLAVAVLAVSTWEVDVARFGRMYAPFQAVFAWYLVYFIRYTVDRQARALWPMLALSVVGVFTWEGGVFMTLANLLPPFLRNPNGKLNARDLRYLAFAVILLALSYFFETAKFRTIGTEPFSPAFQASLDSGASAQGPSLFALPTSAAGWIGATLALIALAGLLTGCLRWIVSLRDRWPAALGVTAALASALAGQFAAVAFIMAFILLAGMLDWRELRARAARPFVATVLAMGVAWTVLLLQHPQWLSSIDVPWEKSSRVLKVAYELLRYPDVIGVLALPWSHAAPILGALLLACVAFASMRVFREGQQGSSSRQVTLVVIVALLAGAAMSDPPRYETRYVFFLFPAAIVIAMSVLTGAVSRLVRSEATAAIATLVIAVCGMAIAGDFSPHRLVAIDTAAVTFRRDVGPNEKLNVLGRADTRSAAMWLAKNAVGPDSITINAYPGVDFYYTGFDSAYIDMQNERYVAYACKRGTVERWGNLPLLDNAEQLNARIATKSHAWIVVETPRLETMLTALAARSPRVVWTSVDGAISIVGIGTTSGHE